MTNPISRIAAIVAAAALLAAPAAAAPKPAKAPATQAEAEAAEDLALQARARFLAKDFAAAAKLFMQAYAKDPKPALVFNAARAYEEAGMKGDAAGLFRLFVTIAKDADAISNAYERLRALEGRPALAVQPTEPVRPEATAAAPAVPDPAQPPVAAVQGTTAPADWPKWVVTGGAVAGLASGVALMWVASSDSQTTAALTPRTDAEIADYNARFDSAERMWTAGIALTAVGVGLGAWATWLHLHPGPKRAAWQLDAGPRVARLTVHF